MLHLPAAWVWDFWLADDGDRFHLFFLKASRALLDPDRRHWRATVGHATSTDLVVWTEQPDALVPADGPSFDDLATWTGSIVRDDTGTWRMFYTGVSREGRGLIQRIGSATSVDLLVWSRHQPHFVIKPDPRWYESIADRSWPDEAWRDPWVFHNEADGLWHMLVTARANSGAADQRGVVGHATSADLARWSVAEPLSASGSGFGQLEVLQIANVDGQNVLLFSCLSSELSDERKARGERGGIWAVNIDNPTGPFAVENAYRVADETLYVGRLVQDRYGKWQLLAFKNTALNGEWIGEITDPMPVTWIGGRLAIPPLLSNIDTSLPISKSV
ncbi:glycosyl hydrolase family 32 [Subtercola boreus]|uniref:beta-fructofuranosidase n=1 Tax=Subtercola boreus TaxID=120213 RepID=A0A3E0W926_9MICO|nr:glycosyl hydrolase family 32 [Subtercola boreus]RFA17852.1 glycosyl hydrolase family 32 [Subtercola boreus]RFA24571.1 glycosyl hydrolase family 32 [Subtercola boreus]